MKLRYLFVAVCLSLTASPFAMAQKPTTPADLRKLAQDYYNWRNRNFPVFSSDAGLHTWDNKLTDYGLSAILARRLEVKETLSKGRSMPTANWSKDDKIDWLLFKAQLENVDFFNRVMDFEASDPQVYVNECSNGIFSLLKKEYDTPRNRALSASARLKQMPFVNTGVRIEDDYIVTSKGLEWISRAPREIAEIEAMMRRPIP